MPSTPTAIKYAPRLPGFTYAVAGDLTIWARPTFETVGLNPPRRDLLNRDRVQFAGVGHAVGDVVRMRDAIFALVADVAGLPDSLSI